MRKGPCPGGSCGRQPLGTRAEPGQGHGHRAWPWGPDGSREMERIQVQSMDRGWAAGGGYTHWLFLSCVGRGSRDTWMRDHRPLPSLCTRASFRKAPRKVASAGKCERKLVFKEPFGGSSCQVKKPLEGHSPANLHRETPALSEDEASSTNFLFLTLLPASEPCCLSLRAPPRRPSLDA